MLTSEQIKLLVIHLVRDPDTIRAALPRVPDDLFDARQEPFERACWRVSREGFVIGGKPVPRDIFAVNVKAALDEHFPHHNLDARRLDEFFDVIFRYPEASLNGALVKKTLLEPFVVGRRVQPDVHALLYGDSDQPAVIERMYRALQEAKLSTVSMTDVAQMGADVFQDVKRVMTGCAPIDELTGGVYAGQSIGLLGPMKGGKTSLCQSLACEFIQQKDDAGKFRRVTYFTYEESAVRQLPKLLICYVNRYHRDLIEGRRLSDMPANIAADLRQAHQHISLNLTLVDMSGAVAGQGAGGPSELSAVMNDMSRAGTLGSLVIVDHALPLVRSYIASRGADPAAELRHALGDACNQFRTACDKLGIAGLLAHQMDAKGNTSKFGPPTHMNAAENKLFGELLHDCLCLGVRDARSNIAYLNMSASRNRPTRHVFVRVAGERCRVDLARNFTADPHTGRPVSNDEIAYGVKIEDSCNAPRKAQVVYD